MTKRMSEEGYSVNFALEMIRTALRDSQIAGMLVRHELTPRKDDDNRENRHFSWWGEVQAETMVHDLQGECWIQRGKGFFEGSSDTNHWKYGQLEFTADTGTTVVLTGRMFYRYDEKSGMELLRRHDIEIEHNVDRGDFSARFSDQFGATVHGAKSKEEAAGMLLFCFPERLGFVLNVREFR